MENDIKQLASVPYVAYESALIKAERRDKRNFIIILVLIILLVASNIGWLVYESQFEDTTITQENADGYNNYIGNDGDILNGKTDYQD